AHWYVAGVGQWKRHLRQPANACDTRECQGPRIIVAAARTTHGWIVFARSERGCRWHAQQIVRSEKVVQLSQILVAAFQRFGDAPVIELVHQFKTRSYVGAKFRLGVSRPHAQATLDLRPLDHAENLSPPLKTAPSFISGQVAQR